MDDNRFEAPAPPPAPPPVGTIPPPPVPATTTATAPVVVLEKKSPGLAGVLSMFPGLGHLYLGLYQRAFAFAGVFCLLIFFNSHGRMAPLSGPATFFVWFFAIIDAVRQAKAINSGLIDTGGLAASERVALSRPRESMAGLTWGVILVGLGALWLLDRYVDLDAFWAAVEDWVAPVAFILLGVVLIVTYVAKKRRHNASETWPPRT
jgi:hypothetical protein